MLSNQGADYNIGRDKLFRIMRANNLDIKPLKSYHVTTNSHHRFRKHKNLVDKLDINRSEQVWVSDITYIGTRENPRYLALITDAYSKKIVGYDLSPSLSADGAIRALKTALKNRDYQNRTLIHHSDRGIQYCCDAYQNLLNKYNIKVSMTESYDPYANAVAERVNGILKNEFLLDDYKVDLKSMKLIVGQSVRTYNQFRPHMSCALLTPLQMHSQEKIRIKTYKKSQFKRLTF
jgi:transposase InsO family protein